MNKYYITANQLLSDSFLLAEKIYESGFRPDFIIGVWRGGAPVGIAVQEYLEYVGVPTDHISIRTSSYTGIDKQEKEVRVHGLDYIIDNIRAENNVLLVDDVYDSGRSIQAIFARMKAKTRRNMPANMKVATPWYKPNNNITDIEPDFYLHETDQWLVFPHELNGLSLSEIKKNKAGIPSTVLNQMSESTKR